MTASRKFYIGSAVFNAILGFFVFNPLYIGFDLLGKMSGGTTDAESFFGILIWFCTALAVTLIEIAVYVSFKFLKPKKKKYLLWSLTAFFAVLVLRIGYAYLQSWVR